MEGSGSITRGRSRGGSRGCLKAQQTRRAWSNREEEVLVNSIKDILGKGWKSDNGFRAGYLNKLEDFIVEALPGTDLCATPHIHSKMTIWKRTFASLSCALARSEVGYNERTNMMDCDDETWALIVKADKNAETMRFKSFPLYPMWTECFGKDRANGQRAEDVLDAFTNLMREDLAAGVNNVEEEYDVDPDDNGDLGENGEATSVCGGQVPPSCSKREPKKRRVGVDDDSEQLRQLIGSIVSNTSELKDVTRFIGYEHGLGQKREAIFNLLSTVDGLSDLDRYDLADVLGKDSDRLEVFNGLPEEHKAPYLQQLVQRLTGV